MNIKKCDICGTIYEKLPTFKVNSFPDFEFNGFSLRGRTHDLCNIDICQKCIDRLLTNPDNIGKE